HQVRVRVRIEFLATPLVVRRAEPGFEEQLVGPWRRPSRGLDALRAELAVAVRLGRCLPDEVRRAGQRRGARALAADGLLVPRAGELVTPIHLPGDARRVVLPRAIGKRRLREIGVVEERVRVAGVLVVEDVQRVLPLALLADAHVVPELVLYDRAADRSVDVVHAVDRSRLRDAAVLQLLRVVVRLHALREAGDEQQARQTVAALLRDDVHRQAGGLDFAETTRRDHRDFLRIADVGREVRWLVAAGRV